LGISDAAHQEITPEAAHLLISKMFCSLVGVSQTIVIRSGTRTEEFYGKAEATEQFRCSYGLAPEYRRQIAASELQVTAVGPDDEARVVELPRQRFFLATLYLPQLTSSVANPHPLIIAFLRAAAQLEGRRD
jgi:CTP synthase (UTP-ammonia lyase)